MLDLKRLSKFSEIHCPNKGRYRCIPPYLCIRNIKENCDKCSSCKPENIIKDNKVLVMKNHYVTWDIKDSPDGQYIWDYKSNKWILK